VASPVFLTVDQVIRIHAAMVERYGGDPGIRDRGLLASAVAVPGAAYGGAYMHADLIEMAAAYLFHIVGNHPFIDGNKRAGAASAIVFLAMNGVEIEADQDGLADITLAVASSKASKAEVAAFFRGLVA
jgi:death-on-curing protein